MQEEFREITGTNGIYQISNLGRVRSNKTSKPKILKGCVNQVYRKVHLNKQDRMIHQLVAEAFLGHTLCGHAVVVKHRDGDRLNNRLDNLELVHHFQDKSKRQGLSRKTSKYVGVSWAKNNCRWIAKIYNNGKSKHLGSFDCEIEASEAYQAALKNI